MIDPGRPATFGTGLFQLCHVTPFVSPGVSGKQARPLHRRRASDGDQGGAIDEGLYGAGGETVRGTGEDLALP